MHDGLAGADEVMAFGALRALLDVGNMHGFYCFFRLPLQVGLHMIEFWRKKTDRR